MCEANVYLIDENGNEKLFLESVDKIVPEGSELCLEKNPVILKSLPGF
jgi:hypothetical protein